MTQMLIRNRRVHTHAAAIVGLGGVLLLAACASTPAEPTVALQAAEQAIAVADRTRVADASSPELSEARDKLTAAHSAVQDKQMITAERFALESRVDAELASAKIEAIKSKAVNDEIISSTHTLQQEMQRNSGVK